MKPQQGPAPPCGPLRMASFPLLGSLAAPQHGFSQLEATAAGGHSCRKTGQASLPVGVLMPAPSPSCSPSSLKELNVAGETLMYECQHPVPLLPLRRAWLCFPASKSKSLAGFSPNWGETGKRARKIRKQQSLRDMESHWVEAGAGEAGLRTGVSRRKKGNGALNTWLWALKAVPLWHFLKLKSGSKPLLKYDYRWTAVPWRCWQEGGPWRAGVVGELTEQLSVKLRARKPFHSTSEEQSRSRTPWLLEGAGSGCQTQHSLPLFSGPICLFSPATSWHIKSQKLGWNLRASGIISLHHFPNKNLSLFSPPIPNRS